MNRSTEIPTLLIFTLGPAGERSRRLLPRPLRQTEASLLRHGLQGALDAGRQAGLRVVVSSPEPLDLPAGVEQLRQQGCRFGDRLRNAMRTLQVELRGSPLLVVGSDSPDLGAHHLRAAIALLGNSSSTVVLGPSLDGGFYLLATRVVLDAELDGVRWCRHDTRRSLEARLQANGRTVKLLDPLQDLDRYADVELWLAARAPVSDLSWMKRLLSRLLAAWRRPAVAGTISQPNLAWATTACGRGPPG